MAGNCRLISIGRESPSLLFRPTASPTGSALNSQLQHRDQTSGLIQRVCPNQLHVFKLAKASRRCPCWRLSLPMAIGILGKKLGMSQFFNAEGKSIPVTLIEAGPCRITQLKTPTSDGYTAVQVGFGEIREKLVNQPARGHLAKSGSEPLRHLTEYRLNTVEGLELGEPITVERFEAGQKVDVSGDTIGRGFSGYQKRHGFTRGPMTHGSKNHRQPGSTGAGTTPGRVYPGKRMAGRYGGKQITTRGLTILKVDTERNLLVVKGSVPGKPGALLNIRPALRVGAKDAN